jgi:hypothetical protein
MLVAGSLGCKAPHTSGNAWHQTAGCWEHQRWLFLLLLLLHLFLLLL